MTQTPIGDVNQATGTAPVTIVPDPGTGNKAIIPVKGVCVHNVDPGYKPIFTLSINDGSNTFPIQSWDTGALTAPFSLTNDQVITLESGWTLELVVDSAAPTTEPIWSTSGVLWAP